MIIHSRDFILAGKPRHPTGDSAPITGLTGEYKWKEEELLDLTPTEICNLPGVELTRQELIDRLNTGMTIREAIGK